MSSSSPPRRSPFQRSTAPDTCFCNSKAPEVLKRHVFSRNRPEPRGGRSLFLPIATGLPSPASPLCRNGPRVRWPGAVPGSEGDQEMYGKCLLFSLRSKISEFRHPSVQGFQKQDCEPGMAFSGARKAVSPQPLRPGLVILCVNIWRIQQFCPRDGNPAFLPRENEGRNTPGPRGFSGRRWGTPVGTRTSPRSHSRGRSRPFRSGLESSLSQSLPGAAPRPLRQSPGIQRKCPPRSCPLVSPCSPGRGHGRRAQQRRVVCAAAGGG